MTLRALLVALLAIAALAAPVAGLDGPAGTTPRDRATCGSGAVVSDAPTATNASISATTLVAPSGTDDRLRNASAIAAAREAGWLTPVGDGRAASDDVVVHRFALEGAATGLLDGLVATNRTRPTAAFLALVRRPGVDFDYVGGVTNCPDEVALNATAERGALRVVPDRDHGRLYVVADLDGAVFDPYGTRGRTTDVGEWGYYRASLALSPESGLVGTAVGATAEFDVRDRAATLPRSVVHVSADRNRTVAGTTTVAPGTDLRVRLRPLDDATETWAATATVARNGTFAARFDLSGVGQAVYEVRVPGVERVDPGRPLVVVGNASAAAIHQAALTPDGRSLALWATTTHGGLLVVRNASGGVVTRVSYPRPGTLLAEVPLPTSVSPNGTTVVAYRDVDGDRRFDGADRPYRTDGTVVRATATVWRNLTAEGTASPTPTPRETPSPTPGPTSSARASPTPGPTPSARASPTPTPRATGTTPAGGAIPAPGAVGAALALLVAARVARRR